MKRSQEIEIDNLMSPKLAGLRMDISTLRGQVVDLYDKLEKRTKFQPRIMITKHGFIYKMKRQILGLRCPECDGSLKDYHTTGKIVCEHCQCEFEINYDYDRK